MPIYVKEEIEESKLEKSMGSVAHKADSGSVNKNVIHKEATAD